MPDTEEKTVDIDTTGPGAEVDIPEEKKEAEVIETVEPVVEEKKEAVEEKQESSDKQQEAKEEKPKQEQESQLPAPSGWRL